MEPELIETARILRRRFVAVTVFVFVFSVIYEHFGHGVWSPYMIYAWCAPFVLGVLPMHVCMRRPVLLPGRLSRYCLFCAAATITVGCVIRGVLDIYGTGSRLCVIYPYAAAALLLAAVVLWLHGLFAGKNKA